MSDSALKKSSKLRKVAIISGIVVAVCLVLAAVGYWLVVPGIADSVVRNKLEAAEKKLGVDIEMQRVATSGLSGVSLHGFKIVDPETEAAVVEVGSMSASIDAFELLLGNRELSGISVSDATLHVHRNADGSTNLEQILARRGGDADREDGDETTEDKDADDGTSTDESSASASFLRFFGGEWPDVDVKNAKIVLTAAEGAEPWPVDEIATDALTLDSDGESARFETVLALAHGDANPRWTLPQKIDIVATLRVPLLESTGNVTFDTPLEVVDVGPYPFLRLGVGGFSLDDDNTVGVHKLSLGVQGAAEPTRLVSIERVAATLRSLEPNLENLRPLEVRIEKPVVTIDHDAQYGSGLSDLNHLLRRPLAHHVRGQAKGIVKAIVEKKGLEFEEDEDKGGGLMAKLGEVNWTKFLGQQAPQQVVIEGATIEVSDKRPLALATMDETIALRDGYFEFNHRAIHGELVFSAGFVAQANGDEPRGKVDADFSWSYRDKSLELDANLDSLSLPWLVQLAGGQVADKIRGGVVRADIEAKREAKKRRLDLKGLLSIENGHVFFAPVTEEPIEGLTASYVFEAHYDPKQKVPEPKLLKERAIDVNKPEDDDSKDQAQAKKARTDAGEEEKPRPPQRGAFVVSKGEVELNGVKGEFMPAIYGLDGAKRPARFDLAVRLPKTDVMNLFDAVPVAIQGPVAGTKMKGSFGWTLDAEVPLYDAGDMKWKSKPLLENFELVSMPKQVDVHKMREEFELEIYDPTLEWKRKVTIPEMRPVPIEWLVSHSGLTAEEFEERRKEREWPPRYAKDYEPDPDNDGIPNRLMPHPAPWQDDLETMPASVEPDFGLNDSPSFEPLRPEPRQQGVQKVRTKPKKKAMVLWKDEKKEHPYGEYTYVPLQYISPWMVRAAMTTEDNSFFKHHGFNWYALKDSVEDNIEAGAYVRGASTISMQLVKNVFLNRKKVLARKIQEAFLVWIMEDVVDVPKARLLELYFNVIEYGPGIYGIHDAAVHYFGKRPDKLTLTEVAWLVSIVPNPKKYHIYYERGRISNAWFRHMLRYVRVMHNRGRVTELEYELAKNQKPEFYKPADGEPLMRMERDPNELDEIEKLKEDAGKIEIPGLQNLFGP
ncbi:hypothetical protein FIV42_26310 [Persicimonas caeni]|uniref:Glycosyl transferase family 51 domain-containing protein n=1 Tax=Persicimonas caeni TaxID=2292766 RepID=A0A4Y6Q0L3_PERCE|nr:biosynthetic peptidoglycan transglycosylase [Persicimonas caeni]QDG54128.1 hypothetical protein FIV42_26310 [Persicimonas caeni]QED35349.1 hypothetical protein FRD00_26305 [Persicimonas caeni]